MKKIESTAIRSAAAVVARASKVVEEANAALTVARVKRDSVTSRVNALESERAAILAKRRSGNGDDDKDGARLAIIAADLTDLTAMVADADQAIKPVQAQADEAMRHLVFAQAELDRETQNELLSRQRERAEQLSDLLMQAIDQIEAHKPRMHTSRNLWEPPAALAAKIHKLDLTRV